MTIRKDSNKEAPKKGDKKKVTGKNTAGRKTEKTPEKQKVKATTRVKPGKKPGAKPALGNQKSEPGKTPKTSENIAEKKAPGHDTKPADKQQQETSTKVAEANKPVEVPEKLPAGSPEPVASPPEVHPGEELAPPKPVRMET